MARKKVVVRVKKRTASPAAAAVVVSRKKRVARKVVKAAAGAKYGGISSAAVEKATGRGWEEWLGLLDRAGAKELSHKEIAAMLHEKFACPPWWSQMVTVGYEQARGQREKHQVAGGYSASASKVVNVPIAMLYEAWADAKLRGAWLGRADMEVRKATPRKSMRVTWEASRGDEATNVEVMFYEKGAGKSQVTVQHGKLRSSAAVEKMKGFWRGRLEKLKAGLEGGT